MLCALLLSLMMVGVGERFCFYCSCVVGDDEI